jgi:beta-glucanase (GH16 family)
VLSIGDTSFLQITARSEAMHEGFAYTSGRVHTRNHPIAGRIMPPKNSDGTWVDGGAVRVEAKLRLPEGTPFGTWSAFWMLPSDKVPSIIFSTAPYGIQYSILYPVLINPVLSLNRSKTDGAKAVN